jgi:phosphopantothenoylcysteine synthetase/decarboxylase
LVWTAILSILAGSAKSYAQTPEEQVAEQMEEMLASQQGQLDIISPSSPGLLGKVANATGTNS